MLSFPLEELSLSFSCSLLIVGFSFTFTSSFFTSAFAGGGVTSGLMFLKLFTVVGCTRQVCALI